MKRHTWNLCGLVSAAWIVMAAPGDLEVYCSGGMELTERWPSSVKVVPWDVTTTTIGGEQYVAGLSAPSLDGFSASLAPSSKPGLSALIAAAQAWNVKVMDGIQDNGDPKSSSNKRATTIEFSKQPTLVPKTTAQFSQSVNIYNRTYVPVQHPIQCCAGHFRLNSTSTSIPDTLWSNDGRNTVDFVTNGDYWFRTLLQSQSALAVAFVRVNGADIEEFDIGFNNCGAFWETFSTSGLCAGLVCRTYRPGYNYAWAHESKVLRRVLGSAGGRIVNPFGSFGPQVTFDWPQIGMADVQGVLTHEFGHALGLGHSYHDGCSNLGSGDPDPTEFPTMFPRAQVSPMGKTYPYSSYGQTDSSVVEGPWTGATLGNPASWPAAVAALEQNGSTRGLLGYSARSLELDDIAAIGRGYPSQRFRNDTRRITGQVVRNGQPYRGALVMAFESRSPRKIAASTLTYANGSYDLRGLPAGRYLLRVEPFPKGMLNFTSVFPSYVSGSCPVETADFPAEYWNKDDQSAELANAFTLIDMTAVSRHAASFVLDGGAGGFQTPVLTVTGASGGSAAPEGGFVANRRHMAVGGAFVPGSSGVPMTVNLRIDGAPAYANQSFVLVASRGKDMLARFGQVTSVIPDASVLPGSSFSGTLDGSGVWQGSVVLDPSVAVGRDNVQFEAYVVGPSGTPAITNSVGAWFWY